MTLYFGADGRYYTPSTVCEHIETGQWRVCLWDADSGRELVETEHGELLMLVPVDEALGAGDPRNARGGDRTNDWERHWGDPDDPPPG